jgi:hypothetical protein
MGRGDREGRHYVLKSDILELTEGMVQRAQRVVRTTAKGIMGTARLSMTTTPKTGLKYRRGGKIHIASSPGNPPAVDTDHLRESIQVENAGPLTSYVNVHASYGLPLEVGTRHIAPRPFLAPAMEEWVDYFEKNLGKAVFEGGFHEKGTIRPDEIL